MKRVIIVHRWGGTPEGDWYPWLAEQLRNKGMRAETPAMPDTERPNMTAWVAALRDAVGVPDSQTYLVGHSIGCQAILRYLQDAPQAIGGAVFVAPWYTLNLGDDREAKAIAKPWIETAMNEIAINKACPGFTCIFSDNDPYVPAENMARFKHHVNAKVVIESGKGHFEASEGITELPSALNSVLFYAK